MSASNFSKTITSNYKHLNEEEKGVLSIIFYNTIMLFLVLVMWVSVCWMLEIPELLFVDALGCLVCLGLIVSMYFWKFPLKLARFILTFVSIIVSVFPVILYGLDTLFTLHLIIIPMSAFLLFTRNEKKVFIQYFLAYFFILITIVTWDYFYGGSQQLDAKSSSFINVLITFGGINVAFYYAFYYYNQNSKYKNLLSLERDKSDRLLFSLFPEKIAKQLRESNKSVAQKFENVTVIFIDLVGFTKLSSTINPTKLVEILDDIFSAFDQIVDQYKIEKIKTIGDAYMAVCGLPNPDPEHAQNIADMALEVIDLFRTNKYHGHELNVRIGIHSGPVVAGVIGNNKFSYDLWGDTVNTASRYESSGTLGKIHLSEKTRNILGADYAFEDHGEVEIKGKGKMKSFYLVGKKPNVTLGNHGK